MKQCHKCGETKSPTEFAKRSASPDGLQRHCKVCNSEANKKFRNTRPSYKKEWDAANPGAQAKIVLAWTKQKPEQYKRNLRKYHQKWGSGVYRVNNLVTGDSYIGSSRTIYTRMLQHFNPSFNGASNKNLKQAMAQYGHQWFTFEIIEKCADEDLLVREQFWIDTLNPTYNLSNPIKKDLPK
jgi:hypothetical protein